MFDCSSYFVFLGDAEATKAQSFAALDYVYSSVHRLWTGDLDRPGRVINSECQM